MTPGMSTAAVIVAAIVLYGGVGVVLVSEWLARRNRDVRRCHELARTLKRNQ